jgi:GntR family transcriptional regulator
MPLSGPLDKHLAAPLYHQLQEVLKAQIENATWSAGEQLPNESKLAERFGVSKITVRQALQNLEELGYIHRHHGRGTFVAKRKFDQGPHELTSFTEDMRRHELSGGSRILSQRVAEADAQVSLALHLPARSAVFVLQRIRSAGGEPVTVQTAHVPAQFVPGLELDPDASLYEVLQRRYHLHAARARETYFASAADDEAAALLQIAPGAPVFKVERVTLLPNERPFEYVTSIVRGDRYAVVLDLVKHGTGSGLALTDLGS